MFDYNNISKPDLLFFNSRVITVDPDFTIVEAVAIKSEKIMAVGDNESILELHDDKTKLIDLKGKVLMPGIIDSHLHMLWTAAALDWINCRTPPMASIQEIVAAVHEKAKESKPGEWILGRGWDETKLTERRRPSKQDLDEATPSNPVLLVRVCGHAATVNSMALKIARISDNDYQPLGGRIARNKNGKPTGLLEEASALALVKEHIPSDSIEKKVELIKRISYSLNEVGLTSVIEPGLTVEDMLVYQKALHQGVLTVRVGMLFANNRKEPVEKWVNKIRDFPISAGFGNDKLRFLGLKLWVDGGIGSRTALLREHYRDEPDNHGLLAIPEENLQLLVDVANLQGMMVSVHAAGGRAMDIILRVYEKSNELNSIKDRRFSIVHAYQPSDENLEQCRNLGITVASQPSFLYFLGNSFHENLGDHAELIKPHKRWIENGIIVASGTDSPVTAYNPFPSLWASISRETEKKRVKIGAEQSVSREDAIRMYTINGAYLSFEENMKGSVEAGKLADLIVLDTDILNCPENQIKDTKVLMTLVGGKIVFDAGFP